MKMKLHRDFILSSTLGHTLEFKKNEPINVPYALRDEVLAIGGVPADEADAAELHKEPEAPPEDPVGQERDTRISAAIALVRERNDRNDFSATGTPKVAAVEKAAGFKVSAQEISAILLKAEKQ